jgi:hypothetical protein
MNQAGAAPLCQADLLDAPWGEHDLDASWRENELARAAAA